VFRWYLGQSSRWANRGEPTRKLDYQVWCGPAMGAFNEWTRGTCLEHFRSRRVVTVAHNLLYGAAIVLRQSQLRSQGIELPREAFPTDPMELDELELRLKEEG
jgi:trans-AT polyketide synthase, acyltransferase and oxidoreductase domains